MEASLINATKSAPTKPGVKEAKRARSTSAESLTLAVWTARIACLASLSGIPRETSRSKRPASLNAGSKASGRFVAPTTNTLLPFFFLPKSGRIEIRLNLQTRKPPIIIEGYSKQFKGFQKNSKRS